jgi:hypothetical protein
LVSRRDAAIASEDGDAAASRLNFSPRAIEGLVKMPGAGLERGDDIPPAIAVAALRDGKAYAVWAGNANPATAVCHYRRAKRVDCHPDS